jgi:ATP-binding cassette, subfamily B (MDR/TAP), member 1
MSVMMIFTSVGQISTPIMAISKAVIAACEFFAVIDTPLPTSGSSRPDITGQDIVINNVTFAYPSRPGKKVLDDLSFRIPYGKNIALVGPSGSGKSTVVGLLERWYSLRAQQMLPSVVESTPTEKPAEETSDQTDENSTKPTKLNLSGSITIGDYDLEDLDLQWWRRQIGLVQQEPFLFNDTIFGNVANGLIGTQWADEPEARKRELVHEACQEANAHEFIARLPTVCAKLTLLPNL